MKTSRETAGVAVGGWSTGCAFGDYDGDGWLDLYVAGYVALDLDHLPPAPPAAGAPAAATPSGRRRPARRRARSAWALRTRRLASRARTAASR